MTLNERFNLNICYDAICAMTSRARPSKRGSAVHDCLVVICFVWFSDVGDQWAVQGSTRASDEGRRTTPRHVCPLLSLWSASPT